MSQIRRGLLWAVAALVALIALNALGPWNPAANGPAPTNGPSASEREANNAGNDPAADARADSTTGASTDDQSGAARDEHKPNATPPPPSGDAFTARDMLRTLPIKGRAPKTGYDREGQFGPAWFDVDANGCDTRNDLLRRDLDAPVSEDGCTVLTGILTDPFSSDIIDFQRGETTSILVQIDHVVALSNAWQTGAAQLDEPTRLEFANDPLNLIAVSGRLNAQKGDGDAATWLPPNRDFWCEYVARQVGVKAHYELWVTSAEFERMDTILTGCDNPPALTPSAHYTFRPGSIPGF